jgi:putative transposase
VEFAVNQYKLNISSFCADINISRSSYYYKAVVVTDKVEDLLLSLAYDNPKYGCRKLYQLLRLHGYIVNHKKVSRLYKKNQLHLRVKAKKKVKVEKHPLVAPNIEQHTWSIDFVHDKLVNGRKLRALTIIDEFNREAIDITIDSRINSTKLLRILNKLNFDYGLPKYIRSDNGREFTAFKVQQWAVEHNIQWLFIQPGKPMQNGFCERFNGTYRVEVLDSYLFNSLAEAQLITKAWINKYNYERPHDGLGGLTPIMFKQKYGCNLSTLSCA